MFKIKLKLEIICIGANNRKECLEYDICDSYIREEVKKRKAIFKEAYDRVFDVEDLCYNVFSFTMSVDGELVFKDMVDDEIGFVLSPLSLGADAILDLADKFISPTKMIRIYE